MQLKRLHSLCSSCLRSLEGHQCASIPYGGGLRGDAAPPLRRCSKCRSCAQKPTVWRRSPRNCPPPPPQALPLGTLFSSAQGILKRLEELPPGDERAPALLEQGAVQLRRAAAMVDSLGLFSPNEEAEDIPTSDLKYLLLPFYRGELAAQTRARDPLSRAAALADAAQHYRAFLSEARQYGLLGQEAAPLVAALEERQRHAMGTSSGGGGGNSASTAGRGHSSPGSSSSGSSSHGLRGAGLDPATLRQQKIAKFKREKYLAARLETLHLQQRQELQTVAAADGGCGGQGAGEGDAEAGERELWVLQVEQAALQAADCLAGLHQEIELLRHVASIPEEQMTEAAEEAAAAAPPAMLAQLREATGVMQAGSVAGRREQLRQQVLRPGHVLPTMTGVRGQGAVITSSVRGYPAHACPACSPLFCAQELPHPPGPLLADC